MRKQVVKKLLLVLFFLSSPALPAQGKRPNQCGSYKLYGFLEKNNELTLWKNSQSERRLAIKGECKRCRYFGSLFVEVDGQIVSLGKRPDLIVTQMKATPENARVHSLEAAVLLKKTACSDSQ